MTVRESLSRGAGSPSVLGFHDKATGSCQYLVWDEESRDAAVIDLVQEFDPRGGAVRHRHGEFVLDEIARRGLRLAWILDTHPHADHLMDGAWLKARTGAPHAIGEKVVEIARLWEDIYGTPGAFDPARDFDRLWRDGETFALGGLTVRVMLHSGHTLGSVSYVIGDAAFVHDTFMQPDIGTSRADFPGGDSGALYDSLMSILSLPDETRIFVGHDYGGPGREAPEWESTVALQRAANKHVGGGVSREDFIALRDARDATLPLPHRILQSLQVNLRGGRLPEPDASGVRAFRYPVGRFPFFA